MSSLIGVPGLFDSYKSGNVNICSAPGSGIADDKAIYSYLPEIIKFYLGEEPILENVKTWAVVFADVCVAVVVYDCSMGACG